MMSRAAPEPLVLILVRGNTQIHKGVRHYCGMWRQIQFQMFAFFTLTCFVFFNEKLFNITLYIQRLLQESPHDSVQFGQCRDIQTTQGCVAPGSNQATADLIGPILRTCLVGIKTFIPLFVEQYPCNSGMGKHSVTGRNLVQLKAEN